MDDDGLKELAAHLPPFMHGVDLSGNRISNTGLSYLRDAKFCPQSLLDLRNNLISDSSAVIEICEVLIFEPKSERSSDDNVPPSIRVSGNPLRINGIGKGVPEVIKEITSPRNLIARLQELDTETADESPHVSVGRIVLAGPTEHGKTHLARWLLAQSKEEIAVLRAPLDRGAGNAGTWGIERERMRISREEHQLPNFPDLQVWLLDCGGHPQQIQSHQNFYFSNWSRSVFVVCLRSDRDFVESGGEYQLGLIADLVNQHRRPRGDLVHVPYSATRKLPVVIVCTHADRQPAGGHIPGERDLIDQFPSLDIQVVHGWSALTGEALPSVKQAIYTQLGKLPELKFLLPRYFDLACEEIEKQFAPDDVTGNQVGLRSIATDQFHVMCHRQMIDDVDNRHANLLFFLDNLGYVVAPSRDASQLPATILNPAFVRHFLYRQLLSPKPRPRDGIIPEHQYECLVGELSLTDRSVLESLILDYLLGFRLHDSSGRPAGWLIPDLLEFEAGALSRPGVCWKSALRTASFLQERIFFEFVRHHQNSLQRIIDGGQMRLSLWRDGCILSQDGSLAFVRFDAQHTRHVEVRVFGSANEDGRHWCTQLARQLFRQIDKDAAADANWADDSKPGRQPIYNVAEDQQFIFQWEEAKTDGCTQEQFEKENGLPRGAVKKMLGRQRARRQKAQQASDKKTMSRN